LSLASYARLLGVGPYWSKLGTLGVQLGIMSCNFSRTRAKVKELEVTGGRQNNTSLLEYA
jgi:hypothetical protein